MHALRAFGIIHLFAVLHAAVALLCRMAGINDELVLTLLTIVLIVLIGLRRRLDIEFIAASVIVGNVIGYLLGTGGAHLIELILHSPLTVHAVSTFLTTEILGWSIVWFTKLFRRNDSSVPASRWNPHAGTLLLAVGVIFVLRLAYVELFESPFFTADRIYGMLNRIMSNSAALIIMFCLNVIFVRYSRRKHNRTLAGKALPLVSFLLATTALTALIAGLQLPFAINRHLTGEEFLRLSVVTLLIELILYSATYMVDYALAARSVLRAERGRTHQAQFLYHRLKQQVNPHFLFNSLNILDCLVCEQRTEQASAYIHKLAGIYRYMLQNEAPLVHLQEELSFVEMYVDLLRVRFADSFRVERRLAPDALQRQIVPCSLQLLIENAIKHNIVDPATPLTIRIVATGTEVTVTNELRPKLTAPPSTHVGLNYIRQQYLDLADRPIEILRTEREYRVTLPLL